MTLLVRDEADILEPQIAFHLAAGVDFVVATDHESRDGTIDILQHYARQGVLHVLRESGGELRQSEWVTRMARMAAADFGADWVINSDADEFWWPSGGDLKEVFARIPQRYGAVRTFVRPFLPRPGDTPWTERMTVRFAPSAPINHPSSSFRVNVRVPHRGSADVTVSTGNTAVSGGRFVPLRGWSPVEVLHFPIRSFEHFERKFLAHYSTVGGRRGDHVRAHDAARVGRLQELYDEICVDEGRLRRGLAERSLVVDTRVRDALRALAADPSAQLAFPPRDYLEAAGYAVDAAVLEEGELVRVFRRLDELGRRLCDMESRVRGGKVRRSLARLAGPRDRARR